MYVAETAVAYDRFGGRARDLRGSGAAERSNADRERSVLRGRRRRKRRYADRRSNLSWTTDVLTASDVSGGELPTEIDGVSVIVNGIPCNLFFVAPGQINFLIPYEITTSTAVIEVVRQGAAGPSVTIPMAPTAPAFFVWNGNLAVAEHTDGTLISPQSPAQSSEIVVLYAGGLGRTSPDIESGEVATVAMSILYASQLRILLNGSACPASSVLYAGIAPDFVGLYQINLQLPANLPPNPEIQIAIGTQLSPAGAQLSLQ